MQFLTCTGKVKIYHLSFLHCALSLAAQRIVIGPVCLFVNLSVIAITGHCIHRSSPKWVCRWRYWQSQADECDIILSKYWKLYCCEQQLQQSPLDAILIRQWPSKHDATTMHKKYNNWTILINPSVALTPRLLAFIISQCISGNGEVLMKVLEVGKLHTIKILRRCPLLHNGA